MSKYVMGDVHGRMDKYHEMLEKIGFNGNDELYLLGDVLDRGPDGLPLLYEIMKAPNIHMILGNHELLFLRRSEDKDEYSEVCDFINSLPLHVEVQCGEKNYYLVHGYPSEDIREATSGRPEEDFENPFHEYRLVIGHTPIWDIQTEMDPIDFVEEMERRQQKLKIYKTTEFIDMDCGSGYDFSCANLACMRLDDETEFYV